MKSFTRWTRQFLHDTFTMESNGENDWGDTFSVHCVYNVPKKVLTSFLLYLLCHAYLNGFCIYVYHLTYFQAYWQDEWHIPSLYLRMAPEYATTSRNRFVLPGISIWTICFFSGTFVQLFLPYHYILRWGNKGDRTSKTNIEGNSLWILCRGFCQRE